MVRGGRSRRWRGGPPPRRGGRRRGSRARCRGARVGRPRIGRADPPRGGDRSAGGRGSASSVRSRAIASAARRRVCPRRVSRPRMRQNCLGCSSPARMSAQRPSTDPVPFMRPSRRAQVECGSFVQPGCQGVRGRRRAGHPLISGEPRAHASTAVLEMHYREVWGDDGTLGVTVSHRARSRSPSGRFGDRPAWHRARMPREPCAR